MKNLTFRSIKKNEELPYHLLLLADPDEENIQKYINDSDVFVVEKDSLIVGVVVLNTPDDDLVEIKNLAVDVEYQKQKIGTFLLEKSIEYSREKGFREIEIGMSNSSVHQLYIYQKAGFEINHIKRNYFINNYQKPIYENGIQCKHLIVLARKL